MTLKVIKDNNNFQISLKRPKLRDNAVPIQTEPPDIVELSPDTVIITSNKLQ